MLLNFNDLGWQQRELQHLEVPFTEEEVKRVVLEAPKEKAPRPDGFIGLFFSECWGIIKEDILKALQQVYHQNQQGLHFLNQALVVLIPKKENPLRITDFRPISLTHSFVKIISKILANRLSCELHHIISINQHLFSEGVYTIIICMCKR
jgi:hypothetical protein